MSAHPHPTAPSPTQTPVRNNKILSRVFYRNLALLNLCVLLLPFVALLQNKHTRLAENGENLISAHLKLAPTLKIQKCNKRPGRLIE